MVYCYYFSTPELLKVVYYHFEAFKTLVVTEKTDFFKKVTEKKSALIHPSTIRPSHILH